MHIDVSTKWFAAAARRGDFDIYRRRWTPFTNQRYYSRFRHGLAPAVLARRRESRCHQRMRRPSMLASTMNATSRSPPRRRRTTTMRADNIAGIMPL